MTSVLSEFGFIFQEVTSNIIVYCLFSIFSFFQWQCMPYIHFSTHMLIKKKKTLVFKNSLIFCSTCPFLSHYVGHIDVYIYTHAHTNLLIEFWAKRSCPY